MGLDADAGTSGALAQFSLAIAGVVVRTEMLVEALRPFVPNLSDIQVFDDGRRFLLVFDTSPTEEQSTKVEQS